MGVEGGGGWGGLLLNFDIVGYLWNISLRVLEVGKGVEVF